MALRFAKGPASDGSIGFNRFRTLSNINYPPPLPLVRQIGEHNWLYGLTYLQNNTDKNEIVVSSNYDGWEYILSRGSNKNSFLQQTFKHNELVYSSIMIIN